MSEAKLDHVIFDYGRQARIGLPEAVFCEGKPLSALRGLLQRFAKGEPPILFTRLWPEAYQLLPEEERRPYDYDPVSGTAFSATLPKREGPGVAIVSAGTADARVAREAARTLEHLGLPFTLFEDCGVSGLWRLAERLPSINSHAAIIAVAGMEGALASVLGGLSPKPIFAVPTSVGYGVCDGGRTALSAMLASCAQGVAVFNIDNGYGAACAAARALNLP